MTRANKGVEEEEKKKPANGKFSITTYNFSNLFKTGKKIKSIIEEPSTKKKAALSIARGELKNVDNYIQFQQFTTNLIANPDVQADRKGGVHISSSTILGELEEFDKALKSARRPGK